VPRPLPEATAKLSINSIWQREPQQKCIGNDRAGHGRQFCSDRLPQGIETADACIIAQPCSRFAFPKIQFPNPIIPAHVFFGGGRVHESTTTAKTVNKKQSKASDSLPLMNRVTKAVVRALKTPQGEMKSFLRAAAGNRIPGKRHWNCFYRGTGPNGVGSAEGGSMDSCGDLAGSRNPITKKPPPFFSVFP
jgi:hypothetical protein